MSSFNASSTTTDVIRDISLSGRVALVTGANSGLGVETARCLAAAGAEVVLLGRDPAKLAEAEAQLREQVPAAKLVCHTLDLADLEAVRASAEALLARYPAIDLLINNAGVMATPLLRTAQDFEMQFGTNHLGHFLFTCLLAPALAEGGRVISLSSGGHKIAPVNLEDPHYEHRDYEKWQAYGEAKTANALFAVALDARLKARNIRAFSVHPGMIMTNLSRHMQQEDYDTLLASMPADTQWNYKSVEQGAATSVWAATAPELAGQGGLYLEDCHIAEAATPGGEGGVESYALDPDIAEQLWQLSERCVGERFTL
jgi:NAD(P)-dependent dehydrogenase (short-subunit alcohol dehydrogenase family)